MRKSRKETFVVVEELPLLLVRDKIVWWTSFERLSQYIDTVGLFALYYINICKNEACSINKEQKKIP